MKEVGSISMEDKEHKGFQNKSLKGVLMEIQVDYPSYETLKPRIVLDLCFENFGIFA